MNCIEHWTISIFIIIVKRLILYIYLVITKMIKLDIFYIHLIILVSGFYVIIYKKLIILCNSYPLSKVKRQFLTFFHLKHLLLNLKKILMHLIFSIKYLGTIYRAIRKRKLTISTCIISEQFSD